MKVFNDGNNTVAGTDKADFLNLAGGWDRANGHGGADDIRGGRGRDTLLGDGGNDTLDGGVGADRLEGGAGSDRLIGGTDNDRLYGGGGQDTLLGGDHNDRLFGEAGDDSLNGGTGNDSVVGGGHNDHLIGAGGRDTIFARFDGDVVQPGTGGDHVIIGALGNAKELHIQGKMQRSDWIDLSQLGLDALHRGASGFSGNGEASARISGRKINIDDDGDGIRDHSIVFDRSADLSRATVSFMPGGPLIEEAVAKNTEGFTQSQNRGRDTFKGGDGDDYFLLDDTSPLSGTYGGYHDTVQGDDGDDVFDIYGSVPWSYFSHLVADGEDGSDTYILRPGFSNPVPNRPDYFRHVYLNAFPDENHQDRIILVAQDWGGLTMENITIEKPQFGSYWNLIIETDDHYDVAYLREGGLDLTQINLEDFLLIL